jgi:hypothetical protein
LAKGRAAKINLDQVCYQIPNYNIKNVFEDFYAKLLTYEYDIFGPTIANKSLSEDNKIDSVNLMRSTKSKNVSAKNTFFQQ